MSQRCRKCVCFDDGECVAAVPVWLEEIALSIDDNVIQDETQAERCELFVDVDDVEFEEDEEEGP